MSGVSLNPFQGRNVLTNVLDPFHLTDNTDSAKVGGDEVAPTAPGFISPLDGNNVLESQYQTNPWKDVSADPSGLNAYTKMALGTGPTDQAQAQLIQQGLSNQKNMQNVQQQGDTQGAAARNQMAATYGLGAGNEASLARANMRNQMMGQQGVGLANSQAVAQIGANDAATRNQFLQGLPGQENASAQTQMQNEGLGQQVGQFNISNTLNSLQNKNLANQNTYTQQMAQYGANKNADAMANKGSGGKK